MTTVQRTQAMANYSKVVSTYEQAEITNIAEITNKVEITNIKGTCINCKFTVNK